MKMYRQVDKLGRTTIPKQILKYAGLTEFDDFEVSWNEENDSVQFKRIPNEFEVIRRLNEQDLTSIQKIYEDLKSFGLLTEETENTIEKLLGE